MSSAVPARLRMPAIMESVDESSSGVLPPPKYSTRARAWRSMALASRRPKTNSPGGSRSMVTATPAGSQPASGVARMIGATPWRCKATTRSSVQARWAAATSASWGVPPPRPSMMMAPVGSLSMRSLRVCMAGRGLPSGDPRPAYHRSGYHPVAPCPLARPISSFRFRQQGLGDLGLQDAVVAVFAQVGDVDLVRFLVEENEEVMAE